MTTDTTIKLKGNRAFVERLKGDPTNVAKQLLALTSISDWARVAHRDNFDSYLVAAAELLTPPASGDDVEAVALADPWNPDPDDPFWMLEIRQGFDDAGSWLKNERTFLTTRDPVKALRYPSWFEADCARRRLPLIENGRFEPTEHLLINHAPSASPLRGEASPTEVGELAESDLADEVRAIAEDSNYSNEMVGIVVRNWFHRRQVEASHIRAIDERIEAVQVAGAEAWAALGFYRDDMPPEAVGRFQELFERICPVDSVLAKVGE